MCFIEVLFLQTYPRPPGSLQLLSGHFCQCKKLSLKTRVNVSFCFSFCFSSSWSYYFYIWRYKCNVLITFSHVKMVHKVTVQPPLQTEDAAWPAGCWRSPAGPCLAVCAPAWVISWLGEVRLQVELLGDESEEAGGPGVGPGVAWLGAANTEADDANPGVANISSGRDQVWPGYQWPAWVSLTGVLACREVRT